MMGGSIRLESVLGVGSTLTVDLPIEVADESTAQQSASQSQGIPLANDRLDTDVLTTATQIQKPRILVA